jgi:acyl-CoA synthetase (AMP-forming)/AMP-acid ligase II
MVTIDRLLSAEPIDPVATGEDDVALMQLTSGSTRVAEGSAHHTPQPGVTR